jgi:hypothetical protein
MPEPHLRWKWSGAGKHLSLPLTSLSADSGYEEMNRGATIMWDYRDQRRTQRAQARAYRRQMQAYRQPLAGAAGGIFMLALAGAIYLATQNMGYWFLPILCFGLACCALLSSLSSANSQGIYGGIHGFIWLMTLGLALLTGQWLWLLVAMGASLILGALWSPITTGLSNMTQGRPLPPFYGQSPVPGVPLSTAPTTEPGGEEQAPYHQGYRGDLPQGGAATAATPPTASPYDQPQMSYPSEQPSTREQELPPMQR